MFLLLKIGKSCKTQTTYDVIKTQFHFISKYLIGSVSFCHFGKYYNLFVQDRTLVET